MDSVKEIQLLGHRAEKLTDGSDSVVTADLGQHSTGVEQRAGAQLEEVRRRWEAKPWKRQVTL